MLFWLRVEGSKQLAEMRISRCSRREYFRLANVGTPRKSEVWHARPSRRRVQLRSSTSSSPLRTPIILDIICSYFSRTWLDDLLSEELAVQD